MPIPDYTQTALTDLVSLKGKSAVITGGARGIGIAIARRLAEAGANILIADIDNGDCLDKAIKALSKYNTKVLGYPFDVRSSEEMMNAATEAIKQFGGLDIWVNDAGIYPMTPALEIENTELLNVFDTNIRGAFHGCCAAVKHMKKNGGVIINLSSISGFQGDEYSTHYCTTKFAVRGMTASFAKEFGKNNIRVVGIAPTMVDTPGVFEEKANMDKLMGEDSIKAMKEDIPLGRIGHSDDIARVALFLASDLAAYVTGTTIVVDGGNLSLG